jgi:glycosyltransferase involved in cell wall biosynthesis
MKIALVHDWLVSTTGGGERVLEEIYAMFPAPIYTLVLNRKAWRGTSFENATIHRSFIDRWIGNSRNFRVCLPLFPMAVERFDLSAYDLILSSSHCVAKGVRRSPSQLHICYCHTPMRYVWDLAEEYFQEAGIRRGIRKELAYYFLRRLRKWDVKSAQNVDYFIANSRFVADRIHRIYGREAVVVYPPVRTDYFYPKGPKQNFYITASRLVAYKKTHLIIEAFNQMPHRKLVVVGDGPEMKRLQRIARQNIELVGWQPDNVLCCLLQQARAFIFAAVEDFGISLVEAMACATPVIAYRKGGAVETVADKMTGLFFEEQTAAAIEDAIHRFEMAGEWDSQAIRARALQFSAEQFRKEYYSFIDTHTRCANFRKAKLLSN